MGFMKNASMSKTDQALLWSTVILSILGAADSIYLLIYKLTGNSQMCLGSGGCHDVNFSTYSEIYGIPVSALGIAAFLAITVIALLETRLDLAREHGSLVIFGMALTGVGFSAYLTYLELYVIKAICPFCVASAVIITLTFIIAIIRLVKQTAS
jgi:uncharacterized membrane protein